MRAGRVAAALAAAFLAATVGGRDTAAAAAPDLREIDAANVSSFKTEFNRSSRSNRLVLLLSPT